MSLYTRGIPSVASVYKWLQCLDGNAVSHSFLNLFLYGKSGLRSAD